MAFHIKSMGNPISIGNHKTIKKPKEFGQLQVPIQSEKSAENNTDNQHKYGQPF